MIDPEDPSPMAAGLRELREETGYRAGSAQEILRYYPSYGCGNQEFILMLADDVAEEVLRLSFS